jgi:hypothetical protein
MTIETASIGHQPPVDEKLRSYARRYCWDMNPMDATMRKNRVLLRVMDLGVWSDIIDIEHTFGTNELSSILTNAPAGSLRPRSWAFWHYRLKLTPHDETPPPLPVRKTM